MKPIGHSLDMYDYELNIYTCCGINGNKIIGNLLSTKK